MAPTRSVVPGFSLVIGETLGEIIARSGRGAPGYDPARPPLAVFDWDNTCIYNDIGDATFDRMLQLADIRLEHSQLETLLPDQVGWRARRRPILAALLDARLGSERAAAELRAEMLALYEDLGPAVGSVARYRWVAAMLAGRTEAELEALAEETIDRGCGEPLTTERVQTADGQATVSIARGLRAYVPMANLIAALRDAGWEVRIVSASVEPLIRSFARRFGLPPEAVIGVRLARDPATGKLLPRVLEPFPYGEGKIEAIRHFAGRRPRLAVGDSPGDLPMLKAAEETCIVVERMSASEAATLARARGWIVVHPEDMLPDEKGLSSGGKPASIGDAAPAAVAAPAS